MNNEQREKQIKEAARQRADQYDHPSKWSDTYYGFIDGAKWADQHPQWIPVEEELPEVGEPVWFFTPIMDEPLKGAYQGNNTWWSVEYESKFIDCVTHWMPMSVPQRKEEDNE